MLTALIITLPLQLKLQKSIKFSRKHFSDFLSNEGSIKMFLKPTNKEEIANIISTLKCNKAFGPNSKHFFMMGVFPLLFEKTKVAPVFKKYSKVDCKDYRPISLLRNF